MSQQSLIKTISDYFQKNIIESHQRNINRKHSKLSSYQINPVLVKYLSHLVEGKISHEGIAKALFYPRILGTSITGSFGTTFQKMFVKLGIASGSVIPGMDIEFKDQLDGRKKYCQLKSGPNTINSGDVQPILNEFDSVANLARTNFLTFNNNDLILGIIYGERIQLSGHYQRIDAKYPVYIGQEFWERLTGYHDFYGNLVIEIDKLILNRPQNTVFQDSYEKLLKDIKKNYKI